MQVDLIAAIIVFVFSWIQILCDCRLESKILLAFLQKEVNVRRELSPLYKVYKIPNKSKFKILPVHISDVLVKHVFFLVIQKGYQILFYFLFFFPDPNTTLGPIYVKFSGEVRFFSSSSLLGLCPNSHVLPFSFLLVSILQLRWLLY